MENVKQLKDITLKDKVKGTDNNFHNIIDTTDIMHPETIYEVEFSNGKVKCSLRTLMVFLCKQCFIHYGHLRSIFRC